MPYRVFCPAYHDHLSLVFGEVFEKNGAARAVVVLAGLGTAVMFL
jgi:hypothetical protein